MKDFPQQLSGIEVVWVPLIRLPWRYDLSTNQDGPSGALTPPGPSRRVIEGDVD